MKRNEKKVILLDGINKVAYDLTIAHNEITTSATSHSLITAIQVIRNRLAYNMFQILATEQPAEDFAADTADNLFFLGHLAAQPSAELYMSICNETED